MVRGYFMRTSIIVSIVTIIVSWIIYKGAKKTIYQKKETNKESIVRLVKYILIFLDALMIMGQFEVTKPIMSYLAASSGIVAIILGIAAQDTFGNLCSGLMILIFKPFVEGDLIKVNQGELIGFVESIRFRHTVVRTYENNRIIVPNSTLNSATIENAYFQDTKKDNYLEIEVVYGTDIDLAESIFKRVTLEVMDEFGMEHDKDIPVYLISFEKTGMKLRIVVPSKSSIDGFMMLAEIRYRLVKEFDKENIQFGTYSVELKK